MPVANLAPGALASPVANEIVSAKRMLPFFKLPHATLLNPFYATDGSAAFDIFAAFNGLNKIRAQTPLNKGEILLPIKIIADKPSVQIQAQYRVLIPTGLIFDIPEGYVLKIFPRSGLSYSKGLNLANGVAIIDSDYTDETFVMVVNTSDVGVTVSTGDRIAQGILERVEQVECAELAERPRPKMNRRGGLGSTGG